MITDNEDRARHETVQRMLPKNPERGTYAWWMKEVLRQWTGQHMLDSGFYGRMHSAPVPPEDQDPVIAQFYNGNLEYFTINLGKWLESITEADDEIAYAIEQLLYWYGEWMQPREEWGQVQREFVEFFSTLVDRLPDESGNVKLSMRAAMLRQIREARSEIASDYNLQSWQRELDVNAYVKQAWDSLPGKALRSLMELHVGEIKIVGYGYTYNDENDFSQDFVYALFNVGDFETYAFIRSHNGADARSGFSDPVVVRIADPDYFWSFQVQVSTEHDTTSTYFYDKALKGSDYSDLPNAMLEGEDGELVNIPDDEGFAQYPASKVYLLDPDTGEYTAGVYHEVYGW